MRVYRITSVEALCSRIIEIGEGDLSVLLPDIDPKIFDREIRIEGPGYNGTIPGFLLQGLIEFQSSEQRTFSFLMNGKADLRGRYKEKIWTDIRVEHGSLLLFFGCIGFEFLLRSLNKTIIANLPPSIQAGIFLAVCLIRAGFIDFGIAYLNNEVEIEKIQAQKEVDLERERNKHAQTMAAIEASARQWELDAQKDKRRDQLLSDAFSIIEGQIKKYGIGQEVVNVAVHNSNSGVEAVVKHSRGATKITAGSRVYNEDQIRKIQNPERPPVQNSILSGEFLIVQFNTENPNSWRITLKNTKTNEKIKAYIDPDNLFLSRDEAKKLFDYQRDERVIRADLEVHKSPNFKSYIVTHVEISQN